MFALEINFQDGKSAAETLFVRRPQAIIGSTDFAHVVIEDMKVLNYQLRLVRGVGKQFRCQPIGTDTKAGFPSFLEGTYDGSASFDLGVVKLVVTALDLDLFVKDKEPPDRAGVRVLRQACSLESPSYPAVVALGKPPMVVSFVADQPIFIGRSKRCALRLDSADISGEHARMGFESGKFWIEDLGSTNGTFISGQQVSGRQQLAPGSVVVLGREISLTGVVSEDQLRELTSVSYVDQKVSFKEDIYPILISKSELVRPARFVLRPGTTVNIGREPSSDIWLGAPHISRKHCSIQVSKTGIVTLSDLSTNGIALEDGIMRKGSSVEINGIPRVVDFGGGITVGVCFSKDHEQTYLTAQGSRYAFASGMKNKKSEINSEISLNPESDLDAVLSPMTNLLDKPLPIRIYLMFLSYGMLGKGILVLLAVIFVILIFLLIDLLLPVFT